MESPKITLADVTSYFGIGSLQVLGIALIANGAFPLFDFLERFSQTSVWGILVSIPLILVTYLFGLVSVLLGDTVFSIFEKRRSVVAGVMPFLYLGSNDRIWMAYIEGERHRRLLKGCSLGFITLAIGFLASDGLSDETILGLSLALVVAVLCRFTDNRIRRDFENLAVVLLGYTSVSSPERDLSNMSQEVRGVPKPVSLDLKEPRVGGQSSANTVGPVDG